MTNEIIDYEIYRYNADNQWEVNTFDISANLSAKEGFIETSLFLSESVTNEKIMFALMFEIKSEKLKPLLLAYHSYNDEGTVIQQIESPKNQGRWFSKLNTDKLMEILQDELELDCPDARNGLNLEYVK